MQLDFAQAQMPWWHVLIAWAYLVTNAARVFTYVPQVLTVWRCGDGARSISLLTWSSWCVSHMSAVLYGALVAHDRFLVLVSLINLAGRGAVTAITLRRRSSFAAHQRVCVMVAAGTAPRRAESPARPARRRSRP